MPPSPPPPTLLSLRRHIIDEAKRMRERNTLGVAVLEQKHGRGDGPTEDIGTRVLRKHIGSHPESGLDAGGQQQLRSLARAVPEMNIFVLGFILRIIIGMGVLIILLPVVADVFENFFDDALESGATFVRGLAGDR